MFPIIDVRHCANAFAAGHLYGAIAAKQIQLSINAYTKLFATSGLTWKDACSRAQEFLAAMQKYAPSSVLELEGIAQGSQQNLLSILALNCRSELLSPNFLTQLAEPNECTSIAVGNEHSNGAQDTWLAQNWDWMGGQRDALVLLRGKSSYAPVDPNLENQSAAEFVTLTEAGMLAKIGLNDKGFAVGLNILRSNQDASRPGIAVHWLLRQLLSCHSVEAAFAMVQKLADEVGFGGSSNILCADRSGAVAALELSPNGVARIDPQANGVVCHTNHFLDPHLLRDQAPYGQSTSTLTRLARITALSSPINSQSSSQSSSQVSSQVSGTGQGNLFDLYRLETILRDEDDGFLSICRHPDLGLDAAARIESVAGVIVNVTSGTLWIAPDVPSKVPFEIVYSQAKSVGNHP